MRLKNTFFAALVATIVAASSVDAAADAYPSKAIRLIVPQAPGGTSDIVGRMVALKLSDAFKQSVIVDNRNGASGTIGSAIAAKSPADGYTLLLAYTVHTTAHALYERLPYDPVRSFAAITILASAPLVLVVPPRVQVTTLSEFIRIAKAGGRPLTFGSAGNGSGPSRWRAVQHHGAGAGRAHPVQRHWAGAD